LEWWTKREEGLIPTETDKSRKKEFKARRDAQPPDLIETQQDLTEYLKYKKADPEDHFFKKLIISIPP